MITFLKDWANQIIVATIIATIFEMILPDGNNKKYIKMIIGLYVLFTIIQPIITKVTGKNTNLLNFNYEKYFDKSVIETSSEDFENTNSKLIKQAYIDSIKEDIENKINSKGYKIISCNIEILEDKEQYGMIQNINLKIDKVNKETKNKLNNTIEIEDVRINIDNNNVNVVETSNLTEKEKKEIIEYLAKEYSVEKTIIIIN